jgi:hypothetical protein
MVFKDGHFYTDLYICSDTAGVASSRVRSVVGGIKDAPADDRSGPFPHHEPGWWCTVLAPHPHLLLAPLLLLHAFFARAVVLRLALGGAAMIYFTPR